MDSSALNIHVGNETQARALGFSDVYNTFVRSALPFSAYYDGAERFDAQAQILSKRSLNVLYDCAEEFVVVMDELCTILAQNPALLTDYFQLSDIEQIFWNLSALDWKGIARADVFFDVNQEARILELNSDTPSGLDEAVVLDAFLREEYQDPLVTNTALKQRWLDAVLGTHTPGISADAESSSSDRDCILQQSSSSLRIALVYPTDLPEDMGLLFLYRDWLEDLGCTVVLCAPHNLQLNELNECVVFGERIDILYRHYKTDWWFERQPIWKNSAAYPSKGILASALYAIAQALAHGTVRVVNSFATLVTQNKKCLAFMHERKALFSERSQAFINSYVPQSSCIDTQLIDRLRIEKDQWVLKSDYGCEGSDVVVGAECSAEVWQRSLDLLVPQRWIAQRFVQCERDGDDMMCNYGVYLAKGLACGTFLRRSGKATDNRALVSPLLIRDLLRDPRRRHREQAQTNEETVRSSASFLPSKRSQTESLFNVYVPSEQWRSWYIPLVLYGDRNTEQALNNSESIDEDRYRLSVIRNAAKKLEDRIRKAWSHNEVAVIVDLDATDSLHFVWAVETNVEPVIQLAALQNPDASIDMAGSYAELLEHAGGSCAAQQHRVNDTTQARSPWFVLDARRLSQPKTVSPELFNNAWLAQLPSAEYLKAQGVQQIVYVCHDHMQDESDDVHADFREWHRQGIGIYVVRPSELYEAGLKGNLGTLAVGEEYPHAIKKKSVGLDQTEDVIRDSMRSWFDERAWKMHVRATQFSYMFEEAEQSLEQPLLPQQ